MKECFKCGKAIEDYEHVCKECALTHELEEAEEARCDLEYEQDEEELE